MKNHPLIFRLVLLLLSALSLQAAESTTRFDTRGAGKMRIEGTSVIHDWRAQSPLIIGFLEVGPGFPVEPGQDAAAGKVQARCEVRVPVNSLVPLKANENPEDAKMADKMSEMLKQTTNPMITYRLTELTLKEAAKAKDAPYLYDSKGELVVAGVTNQISMAINVLPLGDKKLKITGTTPLKMTDFKIEPAVFIIPQFKTSPDITIKFEWNLAQKKPPTAGASQ